MYNFDLLNDEEIKLIVPEVLLYKDNKLYTFIITNKRLLILDYPSPLHNSMEDLRISGKMNYIKMKEIVIQKELSSIKEVIKNKDMIVIKFIDDSFIEMDNNDVYTELKKVIIWKK